MGSEVQVWTETHSSEGMSKSWMSAQSLFQCIALFALESCHAELADITFFSVYNTWCFTTCICLFASRWTGDAARCKCAMYWDCVNSLHFLCWRYLGVTEHELWQIQTKGLVMIIKKAGDIKNKHVSEIDSDTVSAVCEALVTMGKNIWGKKNPGKSISFTSFPPHFFHCLIVFHHILLWHSNVHRGWEVNAHRGGGSHGSWRVLSLSAVLMAAVDQFPPFQAHNHPPLWPDL